MTKTKIDEVKEILARRIEEGAYAPGQRLPSERELAEEMKTSRPTIRAALLRLQSENKVDIVPRSGVYVRFSTTKVTVGSASPRLFLAGTGGKQQTESMQVRESREPYAFTLFSEPPTLRAAGKEIGEKLNIDPEVEVWHCRGVHVVSQVPFRVFDSYYPASLMEGWRKEGDEEIIPASRWLRDTKGMRPSRAVERLNVRMPTAEEAAALRIARSQPVLEMDRWMWAKDSKKEILYEYSRIVFNASLHQFVYEYPLRESDG
ncbi:MAG: GntR family transcriptional regulator [Planifilum fimeticola]